jgi:hypothetical protein
MSVSYSPPDPEKASKEWLTKEERLYQVIDDDPMAAVRHVLSDQGGDEEMWNSIGRARRSLCETHRILLTEMDNSSASIFARHAEERVRLGMEIDGELSRFAKRALVSRTDLKESHAEIPLTGSVLSLRRDGLERLERLLQNQAARRQELCDRQLWELDRERKRGDDVRTYRQVTAIAAAVFAAGIAVLALVIIVGGDDRRVGTTTPEGEPAWYWTLRHIVAGAVLAGVAVAISGFAVWRQHSQSTASSGRKVVVGLLVSFVVAATALVGWAATLLLARRVDAAGYGPAALGLGAGVLGAMIVAAAAVVIARTPRRPRAPQRHDDLEATIASLDWDTLPRGPVDAILQAMEQRCFTTRDAHLGKASRWNKAHYWVGVPAALLAGAGAVSGLTETQGAVQVTLAIVALVGSGLAAVATTLNAGRVSEEARSTANAYDALGLEIGVTRKVDLRTWPPDNGLGRESVEDYLHRLNDLAGVKDQSFWARQKTERTPNGVPGAAAPDVDASRSEQQT